MFKITEGKGFHITFANGYTVSVQFGPDNYCDHYHKNSEKYPPEEWGGARLNTTGRSGNALLWKILL